MRKHEANEYINAKTIGVAVVILIILILIIWKPFSSTDDAADDSNLDEYNYLVDLDLESDDLSDENVEKPIVSERIKDKGLCEKYLFTDGDVLQIEKHKIVVEGVGKESVKVVVDGVRKILSEEENEYFDSGIKLGIAKGSIFYYNAGSEQNTAEIMVGCDYDENPNKKYLQVEGEKICRRAYDECLLTFDVKIED